MVKNSKQKFIMANNGMYTFAMQEHLENHNRPTIMSSNSQSKLESIHNLYKSNFGH